jgi:predicted glutamine amidotransferase/7-cyano-7-deazaguanine synthase in queuosine biosynthesis
MCGIYGFVIEERPSREYVAGLVRTFVEKVEMRGSDGFGLLLYTENGLESHKSFLRPSEFAQFEEFERLISEVCASEKAILIVQGRLSTSGTVKLDNQHPLHSRGSFLFHNGIFIDDNLWKPEDSFSDSWKFLEFISNSDTPLDSEIPDLRSENSFAYLNLNLNELILGSNTGSMFYVGKPSGKLILFGSEPLDELTNSDQEFLSQTQIRGIVKIDISSFTYQYELVNFEMGNRLGFRENGYCSNCGLTLLSKTHFDHQSDVCIRCLEAIGDKCDGIANRRSKEDLVSKLTNKRVVVGFSGGRDSSYALAQLSDIPGIEVIAVSYDWGGITDLGRRNQSRVCGILGVEHVWISADIEKKRRNVQKNLIAWCKKPTLSTIPLMLAGDKGMWKFPLIVARKRNADFVVYCTNPLERTDFKVSLTGVSSRSKSTRPQVVKKSEKFQLIIRYGVEIVKNPKLINSSLFDSIRGFKYYFFDSSKNIQYFDYEDWDETKVDRFLRESLSWEFHSTRSSSWRIGDITTPFYNLAYFSALGFSEFDTLRANQVRDGHLTLRASHELLKNDNYPDWDGIQEYSRCMGVSELTIMRGIERLARSVRKTH